MNSQTFIFFGTSGSGKGTQAKLLAKKLEQNDSEKPVLYLSTGEKLRDFAKGDSMTALRTKEVLESGGLMPEFIPVWVWTEFFINNIQGHEHIILDGVSRRLHEAQLIDSALRFYKRAEPIVIFLEVFDDWAIDKLEKRGKIHRDGEDRKEDEGEGIKKRVKWYEENVLPAIQYFKDNPYYKFISVNGEQSIEDVHKEILEKVGL